jgi:sulfatase maturation enzyme AslB (radical SAM superfamily)
MADWSGISALHLVLTAQCNLRCRYCFERNKSSKRMDWSVLRASLDFALAHCAGDVELVFSGGEPLLEMSRIRKAVTYVEDRLSPWQERKFSVLTNGTLIDDSIAAFLAGHNAEVQISFDGIPESQDVRSPGSFAVLDACLDRLRTNHPESFHSRLSVATVVTPKTMSNLPRSLEYFLTKGVPKVVLVPEFSGMDGWSPPDIDRLDAAFADVYELSRRHHEQAGEIPLRMFQTPPVEPPTRPHGRSLCGIMRGEKPAVDTDGQVYGCGAAVTSLLDLPAGPVMAGFEKVRLGHIEDPELPGRLAHYRRVTRPVGLFDRKQDNWSSYGRCRDCKYLYHCTVCPVSIGYVRENDDMNRVPDFVCAFNLVSLYYRERFWARRRGGMRAVAGSQRLDLQEAGNEKGKETQAKAY